MRLNILSRSILDYVNWFAYNQIAGDGEKYII